MDQKAESAGESETGSKCEQSFVTTVDAGDASLVSQEDCVAALDTGATAYLLHFSLLARLNRILERRGIPRITTYPSHARFRSGDGRLGDVRHAANIPARIAANKETLNAFALKGDIPRYGVRAPLRLLVDSYIFCPTR